MRRLLYALRYMCWCCIWREEGPDKPLDYYLHRYDRRQENYRNWKEG